MIERTYSAQRVNEVLNHPSVYPWVIGPFSGVLDCTEAIIDGNMIALFGEHGGYLFSQVCDGVYDGHSAVLPEARGRWAISAAREAVAFMFRNTAAKEIMMACPHGNLAVRGLVRILKAKYRGTIIDGWYLNGQIVPSDIYSLTKSDWEKCQQH